MDLLLRAPACNLGSSFRCGKELTFDYFCSAHSRFHLSQFMMSCLDCSGRARYLYKRLEQVEVRVSIPTSSIEHVAQYVWSSLIFLWPSASYSTSLGGTTLVQLAASVVSLPSLSVPIVHSGKWGLLVEDILTLSHVDFLTKVLSLSLSIQVVEVMLQGHRNSSNQEYHSCWKAFQNFLWRFKIMQVSQDTIFLVPLHAFFMRSKGPPLPLLCIGQLWRIPCFKTASSCSVPIF